MKHLHYKFTDKIEYETLRFDQIKFSRKHLPLNCTGTIQDYPLNAQVKVCMTHLPLNCSGKIQYEILTFKLYW